MSNEPLLLSRIEQLKKDNEMLQQNYTLIGTLLGSIVAYYGGEFRFKPNLNFPIGDRTLQFFEDPETFEMVYRLVERG